MTSKPFGAEGGRKVKRDPSDRWMLILGLGLALVTGALAVGAFQLHHYLTAFGLLALAAAGTIFAALIVDHVALNRWFMRTFFGTLKGLYADDDEFDDLYDDDLDDDFYEDDGDPADMSDEADLEDEDEKLPSFLSLFLQGGRPAQQENTRTIVMIGGSDALAADRQPKHLLRFDLKMKDSFCVDSLQSLKALLAKARTAVGIAEEMGFASMTAKVGGGVQEWDTGCLPFDACYRSFAAMEKNLPADFQAAETEKLDGRYFCRLNFAFMQILLEKEGEELALVLSRGMLTAAVFGDSSKEEQLLNDLGRRLSRPWPLFYSLR